MEKRLFIYVCLSFLLFSSCADSVKVNQTLQAYPAIFPDYTDVVIPPNIAPLNFKLQEEVEEARAIFASEEQQFVVKGKNGSFEIPASKWQDLLQSAVGKSLQVTVQVKRGTEWTEYAPFPIQVVSDKIDAYLAYRLIEPGYELWNRMGIYQRNLESYTQTAILENKMTGNNCMNCHSFCMQNPDKMLFHMRETYPGTYLVNNGKVEKLNTKTNETISSLVYPSWHPSGKYVAFSVNSTKQAFHLNDPNRVEVYDEASDVVVYDVEKHEIVTSPLLFSKAAFETFPTFSPDGKTLYFCTAAARTMPTEYAKVKYNLCSVSFEPETRTFGNRVDTLYNARVGGMSASFPRVSPDGRYLMYTLSGYGNFSIWHKDADLYMLDLASGATDSLPGVNSPDVESYHSWSRNSRWFVVASRRLDGLFTRPFIVYVDEAGHCGKPFLLPQESPDYYDASLFSFNIPEFSHTPTVVSEANLLKAAKGEGIIIRSPR